MAITYRQLRIAKCCGKILFCAFLFGSYWCLKEKRTHLDDDLGPRLLRRVDNDVIKLSGYDHDVNQGSYMVRHLLNTSNSEENCTQRGISSFPTLFTNQQRKDGAIIINFLVAFYMCGVIGYCCSAYFVPSLEIICQDLNLSPDVAGATFMAAGSSAPEFFSAFIGTFVSEDDTGLSAIVGSAAFNVFVIISFCCFLAGQDVKLTWWPLFRDCVIYVISVILLVIFMFDNTIAWWEGLILAVCYLFYIILMYFNPKLSAKAIAWKNHHTHEDTTSLLSEKNNNKKDDYGVAEKGYKESKFADTQNGVVPNGNLVESAEKSTELTRSRGRSYTRNEDEEWMHNSYKMSNVKPHEHDETPDIKCDSQSLPEPFHPPKNWFLRGAWVLGLPTIVLMFITVPDCRKQKWRKVFMLTFSLSVVWLMAASYVLYWMITVIGYTLDIPDTVMGISLLAGGTSVPDLIASVLVVRHGYGDMAISNIIGSNIFEVFVCLGLLWFLKSVFISEVIISSDGLTFTSVVLLLTVAFIVIAIHINGWKLNRGLGIVCIIVYIVFIVTAILRELGIIGSVEPPIYCAGPK